MESPLLEAGAYASVGPARGAHRLAAGAACSLLAAGCFLALPARSPFAGARRAPALLAEVAPASHGPEATLLSGESDAVALLKKHSLALSEVGLVLFTLIFVGAACKMGTKKLTFIARMKKFPCPPFMGLMGLLFMLCGSAGVLVGPLVHCLVMSIAGVKLLFIFMVIANYAGHWKPWRAAVAQGDDAGAATHARSCLANLGIKGGCVLILGYALPHLAGDELVPAMAGYIGWWKRHASCVIEVGLVVLASPWLLRWSWRSQTCPGYPVWDPVVGLVGSVLLVSGPLGGGGSHAATEAVLSGAAILILTKLLGTFREHSAAIFKPASEVSEEQKTWHTQMLMKDVSIIGALVFTIAQGIACL